MSAVFLDTSVQVDRAFEGGLANNRASIDALIMQYDLTASCKYSKLEFKRVAIQNLALILKYLQAENSFWGTLTRCTKLRQDRRVKTLINIATWTLRESRLEGQPGDSTDAMLKMQAESHIRNSIIYLWRWFDSSVDYVFDATSCKRAQEKPIITMKGEVDSQIHSSACKNKECDNANFFQSKLPIISKIMSGLTNERNCRGELTKELENALKGMETAMKNYNHLYDYGNCQKLADVWIHLECLAGHMDQFATKNYKESEILCPLLGLEMKVPK